MTHVVWPTERFYWSVLDLPGIKRPGSLAPGVFALLEDEVPHDSESLHAVGVPISGGRLAVCSIESAAISDLPEEVLSLTPAGVPSFLKDQGAVATQFNLLTGRFEPGTLRRRRVRAHGLSAAAVLVCALLLSFGAHRRTVHWHDVAASTWAQRSTLIRVAVPNQKPGVLEEMNEQLGAVKKLTDSMREPNDAAVMLSQVLESWPTRASATPQLISVSQSGAVISVAIEGDPTPFLRAFVVPEGWEVDEPRLNSAGAVSRVSLQLRLAGGTIDAN